MRAISGIIALITTTIVACGAPSDDTQRYAVGANLHQNADSLDGTVTVAVATDDQPELGLVSQALKSFVAVLAGGNACWGSQTSPFDSKVQPQLVVRRGATGCGLSFTQLRFDDGSSELEVASNSGLVAIVGTEVNFALADGTRQMAVKISRGLATDANSEIKLAAREVRTDLNAINVLNSCITPWGVEIQHGASITGYLAATVPYGSACDAKSLVCNDGVLSNTTHKFPSCTMPTLVSIALTIDKSEMPVGGTAQLTAVGRLSNNTTIAITAATWTVTPAANATVSTAGVLRGVVDGSVSVTAKFGGVTSNAVSVSVYRLIDQTIVFNESAPTIVNGVSKPGFNHQLSLSARYSGGYSLAPDAQTANTACIKLGFNSGYVQATDDYVAPYNETLWFYVNGVLQFRKTSPGDRDHITQLACRQTCKVIGAAEQCAPY